MLPTYFDLLLNHLLPSATSSNDASTTPSVAIMNHAAHVLRTTFVALLPTERLTDPKQDVRDSAREALIAAGRAALRLGVSVGGKDSSPWEYLSRNMVELGFWNKSAKARQQVSYLSLSRLRALDLRICG